MTNATWLLLEAASAVCEMAFWRRHDRRNKSKAANADTVNASEQIPRTGQRPSSVRSLLSNRWLLALAILVTLLIVVFLVSMLLWLL